MRTTMDLPDDLYRRIKAAAALRGIKMKDLLQEILEEGLGHSTRLSTKRGRNTPLPDLIPPGGRTFPPIKTSDLFDETLEANETQRRHRSA
jgi:hypothetical protein